LLITSTQPLGLDKKYLGSHADLLLSFSCWLDIVQQVSVKNKEFSSLSHLLLVFGDLTNPCIGLSYFYRKTWKTIENRGKLLGIFENWTV
jgi:hypothetical protein